MNTRILLCFLAPFVLGGCSYFGFTRSPIATKSVGDVQIAAMEATHRAIIVSTGVDGKTYKYCAEPPPDAVSNITESISAAIKANAGKRDIEASVAAATALARSINEIYSRSHAVQLFRDASFSLCQAHLIGLATSTVDPNAAGKKKEIEMLRENINGLNDRVEQTSVRFRNAVRNINPDIDLFSDYYAEQAEINKLVSASDDLRELRDDRDRAEREWSNKSRILDRKLDDYEPALAQSYYKLFEELLHVTATILEKEIQYINKSELVEATTKLKILQDNSVDIVKAMRAAGEFSTEQVNSIVKIIESMTVTPPSPNLAIECGADEVLNDENICEKKNALKTGEGDEVAGGDVPTDTDTDTDTDAATTAPCTENPNKDADGKCSTSTTDTTE